MILPGDNIEVLRSMPENSVDAIVTDPPYGLSFMGKKWDYDVPSVVFWTEALRVLKPGGHVLCFGGTRTYHRVAVNIEDAGFEIRDSIHWLYGSGFPKSLDVSKALDKMAGAVREVVGPSRANVRADLKYGGNDPSHNHGRYGAVTHPPVTAPATEAAKQWSGWGTALKPGHEPIIVARKPLDGTVAENVLRWGTGALNIDGCRVALPAGVVVRAPQSDPSKRAGTVGTDLGISRADVEKFQEAQRESTERMAQMGRWPPNVVFSHSVGCVEGGACVDGCPVAALDGQTGPKGGAAASRGPSLTGKSTSRARGTFNGVEATPFHGKVDGASGFFPCFYPDSDLDCLTPFLYCAKPARSEREAGCEHLPARTGAEAVDREEDTDGLKSPRAGAGRTAESVKNHHPTVKPVALMRWLVRLATPPGGVVLDPYCGSGTTLVAATLEDVLALGLEREPEYVAIAEARVAHAAGLTRPA